MGRHSAPDEPDEDESGAIALAPDSDLAALLDAGGRHSAAGDDGDAEETGDESAAEIDTAEIDTEHTQKIAVIDDVPPADAEPTLNLTTITEPRPPAEPEPEPPTKAELRADKQAEKERRKADKQAGKQAAKLAGKQAQQDQKDQRKAAKKSGESDTRADLRLLRQNSAARAQAIGAVIASFLVYTLVVIVIGDTGSYLFWLWIPIVASGILVGLVLDLAHRRAAKSSDQVSR